MEIRRKTVVIFGETDVTPAAADTAISAGTRVVGLVVPSNRTGPGVDLVRSFGGARRLPVLVQPPRREASEFVRQLQALAPDLILVWSYSMILPPEVLAVPRLGCVNVHGGLLPQYRGGHVLQWAIINGETETGVTMHFVDDGIDTGPVITQERFPIEDKDDILTLVPKLKNAGVRLIARYWPELAAGTAQRVQQDESKARYHRLRRPEDGLIDWSASNKQVCNLVRALLPPWPGAFTFLRGQKITIRISRPIGAKQGGSTPGEVLAVDTRGARVSTAVGDLLVSEVEVNGVVAGPNGMKQMGIIVGDVLTGNESPVSR